MMLPLPDEWRSLKIKNCAQICLITTLLMYPLLTLNYSSATQRTVCSALVCGVYENRKHIPAAALISLNQHHLMHLAAAFPIQMKHSCKKQSAPVLIDGGFVKMMQLVITSCQTPWRHNSAWQLDSSFDSLELVEFSLNTCHCNELNIPQRQRRLFLLSKHPRDAKLGLHEELGGLTETAVWVYLMVQWVISSATAEGGGEEDRGKEEREYV